ncbi:hypothetical protein CY35_17G031300 [Sphagnum magellanicum]|nr:hypothetical protein CY35_17G031300 [Sphagnum magellanicum]
MIFQYPASPLFKTDLHCLFLSLVIHLFCKVFISLCRHQQSPRPFSDVGLQTNFLSIQGHLLHLHTATFLSQIHPYAFPADEAFPSYYIKFGHMKTSINGQPSSPAQQYKM